MSFFSGGSLSTPPGRSRRFAGDGYRGKALGIAPSVPCAEQVVVRRRDWVGRMPSDILASGVCARLEDGREDPGWPPIKDRRRFLAGTGPAGVVVDSPPRKG